MKTGRVWQMIIVGSLLAAGSAMAGGDAAAGQESASSCAGCHGMNGEGMGDTAPALAGLDSAAFVTAMQAYKSGEKADPMMGMLAQSLSDEDIDNLAAYYASLSAAE